VHWKVSQVNRAIRKHDPMLYAEMYEGRIDIFRRTYGHDSFDVDGKTILFIKEVPYRVLCLTDSWNAWGKPVDWGIEPIMAKLKASDLWARDVASEINSHNEKIDASAKRDLSNNVEAFVKDYRKEFAKTFDDVNTSNMDKRTDRRFKDDKKLNLKG
jgi:hypothetical protein